MRRFVFLLLLCVPVGLWAQTYTPSAESVEIDGSDAEWSQGEYMYDQDSKMSYAFRKTDEHLFIILRTNQRQTLMQSRMAGIEIWVNTDGKKKRKVGVQYPMGMQGRRQRQGQGQDMGQGQPQGQGGGQGRRNGMRQMPTQIKLVRLYGDEGDPIVAELNTLDKPIKVEAKMHEDGFWVYEIALPLEAFPTGKKTKDIWRIGIETPELEMPDRDDMANQPGGGMNRPGGMGPGGMGAGGMGPGGMRPGGMGGPQGGRGNFGAMGGMMPMSIWIKVQMQ